MCGRGAARSAVRCASRLVTAANRTLLLSLEGGSGNSVFAVSIFASALPVRFSTTARLSALGVISVRS